jgi:hypothetical protein
VNAVNVRTIEIMRYRNIGDEVDAIDIRDIMTAVLVSMHRTTYSLISIAEIHVTRKVSYHKLFLALYL